MSKRSKKSDKIKSDKVMSIGDHFRELRSRLLVLIGFLLVFFVFGFAFAADIFNVLMAPLTALWEGDSSRRMIYTAMQEKFFSEVKIAIYMALVLGMPIIAGQVWLFIAPGLYKREKRGLLPFFLATPILFYLGCAFVYFVLLPVAWSFFLGFEQGADAGHLAIQLVPKVGEYLDLVMVLTLAFGICFELPVLLTLLVSVGVLRVAALKRWRKFAYILVFIVAAIFTPPDPISQLALAIPTILLYELAIFAGSIIERARA